MPSLILHIGLGKTGTSALQHWLAANEDALREKSIVYPPLVDLAPAARGQVTRGNGLPVALALQDPEFVQNSVEQLSPRQAAQMVLDALSGAQGDVLLSSEAFQHFDPPRFREFARTFVESGFQIRTICFVRPSRPFYTSVWLQHVKTAGHKEGLADILDRYCGLQMRVVAKLTGLQDLPAEFTVFNYEDAKEDVVAFFLKRALKMGEIPQAFETPRRINTSISSREAAEALGMPFGTSDIQETLDRYQKEMQDEVDWVNSYVTGTPIHLG